MALLLLGAAAAALAAAILGDARLRSLAERYAGPVAAQREQMALLLQRPCVRDTAGTVSAAWGEGTWQATRRDGAWLLRDSLQLLRPARVVGASTSVLCPE